MLKFKFQKHKENVILFASHWQSLLSPIAERIPTLRNVRILMQVQNEKYYV